MADVPTIDLGGPRLPLVGFGTSPMHGRQAHDAIVRALEVGYRHIDTATAYKNEAEVGRAVVDSGVKREDVFITTKLPAERAGRERETLQASLDALGTDHVDLWLIHWPPGGKAAPQVWAELIKLRDEGLTRAIGVSNYSAAQIDELIEATGERPAVNQIPWSTSNHEPGTLAAMRDRGVVVEGYSPLKRSKLGDRVLVDIAAAHGVTPAQVVLRWHLEHQIVVIPNSSNRERIASNFDVAGFSLTPAEVASIDAL